MMKMPTACSAILLVAMFQTGCSTNVSRFQMPGTDLAEVDVLMLEEPQAEPREVDLHARVKAGLEQRGYRVAAVTTGQGIPRGTFLLDVAADWHWDVTWYLLDLRLAIYEPEDRTIVAQAQSQQTSLSRKSVETVVDRAMRSLFNEPDE